jgi:hypothetical protein
MAGVGAVSYDAYGPTSAGQVPSPAQPASVTAAAEVSPVAAAPVAAADGRPGTIKDVIAANVAAKDSAELIGAPSEPYMNSMSQLVRAAANNVQKIGGRLDTEI